MQPAFAARAGVFSAMLAKQGITGAKGIFEGEYGFFKMYERGSAQVLRSELGKVFEIEHLSQKLYPCCFCNHGAITGALDLVKEHNIQAQDIEQVEVITSRYVHDLVGKPFEIRDNPQVDAQFSIPYTVAAAIIRGRFGIAELQESSIRDNQILLLAKKVKCIADESINTLLVPATVRINLRDGARYSKEIKILKGNPANPLTEEEDVEKFNECAKFGRKPMSDEKRGKLAEAILNLEALSDVREIIEYLA
jgi:2-methylcitrate dehydratase PrpD